MDQLKGIDVHRVNRIFKVAMEGEMKGKSSVQVGKVDYLSAGMAIQENGGPLNAGPTVQSITPPGYITPKDDPILPLPSTAYTSVPSLPKSAIERYEEIGLEAIRNNQVGVLLMAGGQGTRLGSSAPKGCYNIGLPSSKSLFQIQAERIKKLTERAGGGNLIWYVMTSGPTRKVTEDFFEKENWFGLRKEDVVFFDQGVLPALSNEGKLLMSTKSSIAVAPDGNGGLYAAIRQPLSTRPEASVLIDMRERGVKYVHAYCVDNCLVRVADPVFVGYCIEKGAACGAKVVKKLNAHEKVGVLALKGDGYSVVEYSELSKEKAEAIDQTTGGLAFRAANIANHFYTTDFLDSVEAMENRMAFHIARKKIPTIHMETGEPINPTEPNGMKLELFVFDVFPFTQRLEVLEVGREDEFSPLKNGPGTNSDNAETSRTDLLAMHARWLKEAGAEIEDGVEIELSPRITYSGEGLEGIKGWKFVKSGAAESLDELESLTRA